MRGLILAAVSLATGCASLPEDPGARGLYRDLRKSVEFRESDDWVVDDLEVDDALSGVMRSVCMAPPEAREDLDLWLAARIEERGGASEAQYAGEMTGDLKETRRLERVRSLLAAAEDAASRCPYWLEAEEDFAGLEGDEGRFVVWLESRGGAALLLSGGDRGIGGGGGGRLLVGHGIGARLTLTLGAELAADGELPEEGGGRRSFRAVLAAAAPLVLRVTNHDRVLDLELAYTARFADPTRHGFRAGIGYGLTTPRVSRFMPYFVIWAGYQMMPATTADPTEHAIWLGTRVGFDAAL